MEHNTNSEREDEFSQIEIWDNSKRARTLIIIFWILTGMTAIGIVSGYFELELLKHVQAGGYIVEEEAYANDIRQGIIGVLKFGLFIVSAIVFLNWFRRAYGNLHRLGVRCLRYKESMALWSWFIPIIFLFRPVQIMSEIWNETQEQIKKLDSTYMLRSGGLIIGTWWLLFIVSNFIGRYALKTAFKQDTIVQLVESSQAVLILDLMQIPEALLVILIVFQISKMETKLVEKINKSGGAIVYK